MRQLEMIVGEERFRDGLREYLKTYAFGNATWLDLIRILDAKTPENLAAWSRAWVEERGRPEFTTDAARRQEQHASQRLTITMNDPLRRGLVWPQRMRVTLGYRRLAEGSRGVRERRARPSCAKRPGLPKPLFILPNGGGLGLRPLPARRTERAYLLANMPQVGDALTRGAAWVTLWDNVLEGRVAPGAFIDAADARAARRERRAEHAARARVHQPRVLALSSAGGANGARAGDRGGACAPASRAPARRA